MQFQIEPPELRVERQSPPTNAGPRQCGKGSRENKSQHCEGMRLEQDTGRKEPKLGVRVGGGGVGGRLGLASKKDWN